ncbi:MAG: hypothetical protein IT210_05630 [Armatimonadetes bacterium]|nr:hypothetical protein [Armatimonadota bacterium]
MRTYHYFLACSFLLWAIGSDPCHCFSETPEDKKPPVSEKQWQAQLVATCGGIRDACNYFGVAAPDGRGKGQEVLIESPPLLPPFVDISFIRPERESRSMGASGFAFDLRPSPAGKSIWNFEVQTDIANAEVTLAWPDFLASVPARYSFTLIDLDSGQRRFMRTTAAYTFRSGPQGGTRRLAIEVDPQAKSPLLIIGLASSPGRGGQSVLRYSLSREATSTARILSLTGKPVRLLEKNRARSAASQTLLWDLRDGAGRRVPSGSYLCQISAVADTGETTLAVTSITVK